MAEDKYRSQYSALSFYSIGGLWGYAVIRLEDVNGVLKVRLAKCKRLAGFPKVEKCVWTDVPAEQISNLSQVQKINFKTTDDINCIAERIIAELAIVEETMAQRAK